jgi:hypothetical protein
MKTRILLPVGGVVLALVCVGAVMLLNHDGGGTPPHRAGDGYARIEGPAPHDADAATATRYGLTAMFFWRPVEDSSPGQALWRAKPWLTEPLLGQADTPPAAGIRPIPQWAGWRASADIVTATVAIDQLGPIEGDERRVEATVNQTVVHADGNTTPYVVMHVAAAVKSTADGWRLSNYRVTG